PGRAHILESAHGPGDGDLDPGRPGRAARGRHDRPLAADIPGGAAGAPGGAVPRRPELHGRRRGPGLLRAALLVGGAPDGPRALGPRRAPLLPDARSVRPGHAARRELTPRLERARALRLRAGRPGAGLAA